MWGYFGISFFFAVILLLLGNLLDIVIKEEVLYFKIKNLTKKASFFLFYSRKKRAMSYIAYYLEIEAYILFVLTMILNIIFASMNLINNYEFTLQYNMIYIYLFDFNIGYFLINILIYKIAKRFKKR